MYLTAGIYIHHSVQLELLAVQRLNSMVEVKMVEVNITSTDNPEQYNETMPNIISSPQFFHESVYKTMSTNDKRVEILCAYFRFLLQ